MKTIWKFQIQDPTGSISIPLNAEILKVGYQEQWDNIRQRKVFQFCLWAMVETENIKTSRIFGLWPTGLEWPNNYKYIDSIIQDPYGSGLVFHAFEVIN